MSGTDNFPPLLETAITEISRLPGIGRKTALRLALHLLRRPTGEADALSRAISELRHGVGYCPECHNITTASETCSICANPMRDHSTICVVETVRDVLSIESTGQYAGVYHVLGGVISPLDGVGPDVLEIDSLAERAASGTVKEVIMGLSPTMEGDTTCFYLYRKIAAAVTARGAAMPAVTQLARGVAVGNELEYTDELTLGRSLQARTAYNDGLNGN